MTLDCRPQRAERRCRRKSGHLSAPCAEAEADNRFVSTKSFDPSSTGIESLPNLFGANAELRRCSVLTKAIPPTRNSAKYSSAGRKSLTAIKHATKNWLVGFVSICWPSRVSHSCETQNPVTIQCCPMPWALERLIGRYPAQGSSRL